MSDTAHRLERSFLCNEEVDALRGRIAELEKQLNSPHNADWFAGVRIEAPHQEMCWGSDHDVGETPLDWFWLIGYLAQKVVVAQTAGDIEKAKHHTIATGAALLNWHRKISGCADAKKAARDRVARMCAMMESG